MPHHEIFFVEDDEHGIPHAVKPFLAPGEYRSLGDAPKLRSRTGQLSQSRMCRTTLFYLSEKVAISFSITGHATAVFSEHGRDRRTDRAEPDCPNRCERRIQEVFLTGILTLERK
ncbi:hypothetical protein [Amycolatopsis sp. NPDC054798]